MLPCEEGFAFHQIFNVVDLMLHVKVVLLCVVLNDVLLGLIVKKMNA